MSAEEYPGILGPTEKMRDRHAEITQPVDIFGRRVRTQYLQSRLPLRIDVRRVEFKRLSAAIWESAVASKHQEGGRDTPGQQLLARLWLWKLVAAAVVYRYERHI